MPTPHPALAIALAVFLPSLPEARAAGAPDRGAVWDDLLAGRHPLHLEDGALEGPGRDFLLDEAGAAQFLVLGELHGMAEVPEFGAALFAELSPLGYDHLAIETSPQAARLLSEIVAGDDHEAELAALFEEYVYPLPFYGLREEAALLASVVRASARPERALWGVDQAFFLSTALWADRLAARVEDAAVAGELRALSLREREALRGMSASKRMEIRPFWMTHGEGPFEEARARLAEAGDLEGVATVDALQRSREVYHLFQTGDGFGNNRERAALMRENWLAAYAEAAAEVERPRVLAKLGAMHAMKGHSPMGVRDLGNLIAEQAELLGTRSFHLLVLVGSGTSNTYLPYTPEANKAAPLTGPPPMFASFVSRFPRDRWAVYDLRPYRGAWSGDVEDPARQIALGFDAVLFLPEVRASTLLD